MRDKGSGFFLVLISLVCLSVVAFSTYIFIEGKDILKEEKVTEYTFEELNALSSLPPITNSEKLQETASSQAVLGKVVESVISPYSANTSYNNVYVKNKTDGELDIKSLLAEGTTVKFEKNSLPQALIIHTHTSESYMREDKDFYTEEDTSRSEDTSKNVVAVGELIANKLNSAGFVTIHDTTIHDKSYTGSYSRSAETIKKYLNEYPSIKLVIDVHRDAVSGEDDSHIKPVININGRKSAQVMLVMCCGEEISDFDNWRENVKFALKYQQTMEVMYPSLARAMHYLSYKYNQNLSTPSILLEVGTEANSIEEALTGADFAANALVAYMNTLTQS